MKSNSVFVHQSAAFIGMKLAPPPTLHPVLFTDPWSACVTVSLMLTALEPVLETQWSFELNANTNMLTMLMLRC